MFKNSCLMEEFVRLPEQADGGKNVKMVIGGAFQGKLTYAMNRYGLKEEDLARGGECPYKLLPEKAAVIDLHLLIQRYMEDGLSPETEIEKLLIRNPALIIICNEIGYGIIPIRATEREYREQTGRICCKLAESAVEVSRVICGIGTVIKGE